MTRFPRRVVITGVGLVTPLGCGSDTVFRKLLNGLSGIKEISEEWMIRSSCRVNVAARVPRGTNKKDGDYDDSMFGNARSTSHLSDFIKYALYASDLALSHAKIVELSAVVDLNRAGVAVGNGGIGSLADISQAHDTIRNASYRRLSPFFVPKILSNMAAGNVSMRHQLRGPVHSVATACAAGSHSIGDAYNFIRLGYADLMLAGGTEASIDEISISGFSRMKALEVVDLSSSDHSIEQSIRKASRPFHSTRSGFVMGEGAGVLVLEELHSAQRRGARILAEVCGYGLSGDAHHATAPPIDGDGAQRSMRMALEQAGILPEDVGYINAHATSTPQGDAVEIDAIRAVFGSISGASTNQTSYAAQKTPARSGINDNSNPTYDDGGRGRRFAPLYVSSTKGATGHLLGAAGAIETAFTAMALFTGELPPTLNLDDVDTELEGGQIFEHIPEKSTMYPPSSSSGGASGEFKYALKNSFGFGGTNASLVLGRFKE